VRRQSLRSERPFTWEYRDKQLVITNIFSGSEAADKGLTKGDIIHKVDGWSLSKTQDFEFFLIQCKAGREILLEVNRHNTRFSVLLTLTPMYKKQLIILDLLLGILFWIVSVFVYVSKSTDHAARVFSWTCMGIVLSVMLFWEGYPYTYKWVEYCLIALYFIAYSLVPTGILYFSVIYPRKKQVIHKYKIIPYILFLPGLVICLLLELTYLSAIVLKNPDLYRTFWAIYTGFRVYLFLYIALSIGCLVHSLKSSETRESRNKIQWILWGMSLGSIPFLFLWTLPLVLGFSPLISEELNYIFLMIIPLAFGFSIVKYKAMDIDVIINRSIVYVIITGIIIIVYLLVAGIAGHYLQAAGTETSQIMTIVFTLIAVALFSPLKQRLQRFIDRTFYRIKYNYKLAVIKLNKALSSVSNQEQWNDLLINNVCTAIPVEKAAIMLPIKDGKYFKSTGGSGFSEKERNKLILNLKCDLIKQLNVKRIPLIKKHRNELSNVEEMIPHPVLDCIGAELIIPFSVQGNIKGLLILGKKMSGTKFSEEDIDLLTTMAAESSMVLERLKLQEAMILEQAEKSKLEELNRLKSEFISHISHELRTPLTSICWSVENLLDGIPETPGPGTEKYLRGILDNSQHLNRMIEHLLDITRIEAGKIDILSKKFKLIEQVNRSITVLNPALTEKRIKLNIEIDKELYIKADPDRVLEIIINLINNGIIYSNMDSNLRIIAHDVLAEEIRAGAGDEEMVAVSVIDQGRGIPEKMLNSIFERFERVQKEKNGPQKGLGLGLYIVKKLVELQKGQIWVESEEGKGSTFTFTLPKG